MEARITLPKALQAALSCAEPKPLEQLSVELGVSEKAIPDALEKLSRSLRASGQRLHQVAAVCLECGFDFGERTRMTKPSRCPRCRSERISPARFWIAK
jgi:predicted Zn-ribbon and HTH transcriptional regulator